MSNLKDILTTVVGIGFLVFTAIQQYLATLQPDGAINWFQLLVAVAVAIIGYFTGKSPNGKSLKNPSAFY